MRHVVYRIFTGYGSTRDVVHRGLTAIDLARGLSHIVAYIKIYGKNQFFGRTRTF